MLRILTLRLVLQRQGQSVKLKGGGGRGEVEAEQVFLFSLQSCCSTLLVISKKKKKNTGNGLDLKTLSDRITAVLKTTSAACYKTLFEKLSQGKKTEQNKENEPITLQITKLLTQTVDSPEIATINYIPLVCFKKHRRYNVFSSEVLIARDRCI